MIRRFRYLIYPKFQFVLLAANAAMISGFLILTIIFLSYSFEDMVELGKSAGLNPDHVYYQFLKMQGGELFQKLLLSAISAFTLSTLFFLWLSHRLVGPIVGTISFLKRYNETIEKTGKPPTLKFRKNDFFQDLATELNRVLQSQSQTQNKNSDQTNGH